MANKKKRKKASIRKTEFILKEPSILWQSVVLAGVALFETGAIIAFDVLLSPSNKGEVKW